MEVVPQERYVQTAHQNPQPVLKPRGLADVQGKTQGDPENTVMSHKGSKVHPQVHPLFWKDSRKLLWIKTL